MKRGTKAACSPRGMPCSKPEPEAQSGRALILVVDDVPTNIQLLSSVLERAGHVIAGAPSAAIALEIVRLNPPDLILLDVVMPEIDGFALCRQFKEMEDLREIPVIFLTARNDKDAIVAGFAAGAVDYVVKPFQQEEVLARVRTHLKIHSLARALRRKNEELEKQIELRAAAEEAYKTADQKLQLFSEREEERWGVEGFIGKSATLRKIFLDVKRLQNFDITNVLITGESGTGKELIARSLHYGSKRKGAFIPVNCAAIPAELAEASFLGHARGSFTGAVADRKGFFELADGGTLFLDEIGEMPVSLQAKLLRVLEDKSVTPLGAANARKINVRIVSATNLDLAQCRAAGSFRQDLYFRLAGFTINLPPLRERREDIPLLAEHLLEVFARDMGLEPPAIALAAIARLEHYSFPGNVRELKNIIERALIEGAGKTILPEHIHLPPTTGRIAAAINPAEEAWRKLTEGGNFWTLISKPYLDRELSRDFVRELIERGLIQTRGSYKELIRLFGLDTEEYPKFMDFLRFHRLKPESSSLTSNE
jgi:DNA-binding NtrC family response regulator